VPHVKRTLLWFLIAIAWLTWMAAQVIVPGPGALLATLFPALATVMLLGRHSPIDGVRHERVPRWRVTRTDGGLVFSPLNPAADVLKPETQDVAHIGRLFAAPAHAPQTVKLRAPDGSIRWLELHLNSAPPGEDGPWEVIGVDVTERHAMLAGLHQLQRDVDEALSCRFHVLYRLDYVRQGYDYISPVAATVVGIALDELRADGGVLKVHALIPPTDLERIRAQVRAAVAASDEPFADCNLEYRLRDSNGHIRWFRDSLRVMFDADRQTTHVTGAILEITETRMTSEHLRVTLQSIGDGVISTDADGRISFINPRAIALTGWPESEALGRPVSDVLQLSDTVRNTPLACPVDVVLREGRMIRFAEAINLRSRDGSRIPVTDSTAPIQMEGDLVPQGAVVVLRDERETRASLQRLHESEARYRTLVESSPVGIFHFDQYLGITFLNSRFAEILHTTSAALIGSSIGKLADQSIMPSILAALRGQLGRYEGPYVMAADGEEIRLSIRTAPVFDADGKVMGGVGIVEDNTAKYAAEQRLRESETRYALAMRGTNEGLWDWNPLTKELFLSSRLMVLLGDPPEAIRTTSDAWLTRIHPDDRDVYYARMIAHLKGETNHFEFEFQLATKSGEYRWFRSRGVAQRDDNGLAYRMVGSIGDITAGKRAQMQLTNELAFSRTLVESLPVGLCVARRDGTLTMLNQVFARLAGISSRDLREVTVPDLILPDDRPVISQRMERAFEEGSAWTETRIQRHDGHTVPVHFLVRRVVLYETEQLLCIATDISERKKAEEKMRGLNRELERRVDDRTAQLAAAVKELEAFSYSVSHDLRSPLRAIDGYTRIIRDDYRAAFSPEAHTLFSRMLAAVARMSELIDDLLELSRVSRRPLRRTAIDLSDTARMVAAELAQRDPERKVTMEIEDDLHVVADAKLLQIAIENLLGNAWKFTAKQPDARVRFHRFIDHGETVFCVEDNGAGFDMRYADKLFGAFQRLHTDRDFEGTGIGLATVARIIQRHGGRVWAVGEPDQGARFYFTLGEADT
jgi:PAS domain S-box-containing protein